ncbi:MAG TPA: bifunctional hydroxymethylpyrimidine kinase/phosphomethylpyrimidine kinase [Anaeromyxobacteraceae bacterium]|nr:bifunctional hydroxymethylpyrimidine kinase/phosphomethylpyrimidine kinase [Anaeromyxobacteraceae bacterium]
MRVALTIAGSDSGGGAGIQADLRTFAAHGLHGASAITAVTAQNSREVRSWQALAPSLVRSQIEAVCDDMTVAAVKTGMLATAAIVEEVAALAEAGRLPRLVVDPVMYAKSGDRLVDPTAEQAYVQRLLPRAAILTPNLAEAEALLGRRIGDPADMREAAAELAGRTGAAVLLKGGRLRGDAVDVLCAGGRTTELRSERVAGGMEHGAGCTLSAALCARLALGDGLEDAVRAAKAYVTAALRAGYRVGQGRGTLGVPAPAAAR